MNNFNIHLAASQVQERTINGKQYVIVPAILMTEGVHNGSGGPLFYSAEELRKSAPQWNNVSVTWRHPMENGSPISVNYAPHAIVGHVQNARMDNGKLKAELVLDKGAVMAKDPMFIPNLRAGRLVDVSTGLFSVDRTVPGVWCGEPYVASATNLSPDHLAVLPDQQGACSFADGCGIRANGNNPYTEISKLITEAMKKEKIMSNQVIINEPPMELPRPFYAANPESLRIVRTELMKQANGLLLLQTMSAAEVEAKAAEITAQVIPSLFPFQQDKTEAYQRTDNPTRNCECEPPMELPKYDFRK